MTEPLAPRPVAEPRGRARWLVIALAISVSLNLFALGFVVARALRPPHLPHPRAEHGPFLGPHSLMREGFGPKARPLLDGVMERHGADLREERAALRKARRAVRDALLSEPFDAAALEQALAALRERTDSSQRQMHEALVELARSLPLEQRKLLARRAHALEALGMGGPRGGGP